MKTFRLPRLLAFLCLFLPLSTALPQSSSTGKRTWRTATAAELETFLPARATVEKERIETELRTATGITDDRGHMVAAVVLITAGYSADGKYSHYLLSQNALRIGSELRLAAGSYVIGWSRVKEGLAVRFFDARSGAERGEILARPIPQPTRVESFRIWPPTEKSIIQIGRFALPYSLEDTLAAK